MQAKVFQPGSIDSSPVQGFDVCLSVDTKFAPHAAIRLCGKLRFILNVLVARLASPSAYGVGYVSLQPGALNRRSMALRSFIHAEALEQFSSLCPKRGFSQSGARSQRS